MFVETAFPEGKMTIDGLDIYFWNLDTETMNAMINVKDGERLFGKRGDLLGLCVDFRPLPADGDFAVIVCEERVEEMAERDGIDPAELLTVVLAHEIGHVFGIANYGDNGEDLADDFAWDILEEINATDCGLLNM